MHSFSSRGVWRPMLAVAILALLGCGEETFTVIVEVRTDLVPEDEFASIDAVLSAGGAAQSLSADPTAPFLEGVRVGEWDGVEAGNYELAVRALDDAGALVVARDVRIDLRENIAVTVLLTRSCAGVVCPGAGDPAQASTCLGGRCVDPACSELDPAACGDAECASASDCTAPVACATTSCVEGACLTTPHHAMCETGEMCLLSMGCAGEMDCGPDGDDDGVDECMDCNDSDPNTYPGAMEVCGDGVTNDCDSDDPPDLGCTIGTYVAKPPLGAPPPMGLGTQDAPVDTIAQAIVNATMLGGVQDVFVAEGTYDEDFTMVEGVSVLGGHDPSDWSRSPPANVTTINCQSATGITIPAAATRATLLDGFVINGAESATTATTITVLGNASPTISNNIIRGPNAPTGGSVAIRINPWFLDGSPPVSTGNPLIIDNAIVLGISAPGFGSGQRNDASAYGIRARVAPVEIVDNQLAFTNEVTVQTAVAATEASDIFIGGNSISDGAARMEHAQGIVVSGSNGLVSGNVVTLGECRNTCTGIATGGFDNTQRIENNAVFAGSSSTGTTVALAFGFEAGVPTGATPLDAVAHSNFFHGGEGSTTYGVLVDGCDMTTPFAVGRLINNVIYSGIGDTRYAAAEVHPTVDFVELTNNALHLMTEGTTTNGALYRDEETITPSSVCTATMVGIDLTTAADVNALTGYSGNIEDDCGIVTPDFHLPAGSMCIDAGTATDAPTTDIDGDARPMGSGFDIGPDEAM